MKKFIFITCFFIYHILPAQNKNYPFEKWDEQTKKDAATAENTSYLNNKEKEIIYLLNLVRINPKLFWETYAQKYITENKLEKNSYAKSLKEDLFKTKTLKYLIPDSDLQKMSEELSFSQEKSGKTGHEKFDERFKKLPRKFKDSSVSESVYYGTFEADHVVMIWLIDDGVKGTEHRNEILNPKNKFVGVSIKSHKKEKNVVVVNYANQTYWE